MPRDVPLRPGHLSISSGSTVLTPKRAPKRGFDSVTVPGAVAGWVALSKRFGKLPFADLLESAIDIAERGYLLPIVVQQKWAAPVEELKGLPGFAQAFLPNARAPNVGELFQFKSAAKGLRAIAEKRW
jgi:gamma-glutamyltranspeptidase/glutathione hydrolase